MTELKPFLVFSNDDVDLNDVDPEEADQVRATDAEHACQRWIDRHYVSGDDPDEMTLVVVDPVGGVTKWTIKAVRTVTFEIARGPQ